MQESKDKEASGAAGPGEGAEVPEEATSSETLSDIEESEKVSGDKSGAGESSEMPSPDGALDSDRSGRDPQTDPGPM